MHTLYPAIKPYVTHNLPVDSTHEIYVEECGSPDGIPVLFVHGGPGGGCSKADRRFFDPEKYRIILFDQRGSGRSKPHAELSNNTPDRLMEDIETIRTTLGVNSWILFGGSWGSTLSLLYAQTHPGRVKAMVLRGIFLARQSDLDWIYREGGASRVFPDQWQDFLAPIPVEERDDMVTAYHRRLFGDDELARMNAAKHWAMWEGRIATLRPNQEVIDHFADPRLALAMSRIECHYFKNNAFIEESQIIKHMNLVARIPGIIIHGRYDMVCPLENAWLLKEHWPAAELHIIRDAGHAPLEPGIIDALIRATEEFARKFDQ